MQTRTSIYHKLILYIFFLGIFVIVAVSLYSFITSRNAIMQRTFDQLTSLRVAKKEQVEQFFSDRLKEVELFSHQENTGVFHIKTKSLVGIITVDMPYQGMNLNFERFFTSGGYYSNVYIVIGDQVECYTADSVTGKFHISGEGRESSLEPVISKVKKENQLQIEDYTLLVNDSTPHLFITSPLFSNDNITSGYALFEIKPSAIHNIMKNKEVVNGLGQSGEVYLVGPDSLMRSESRFYMKSILRLPVKTTSVRNAFNSSEGAFLNRDYRGIMTLSSYSRLTILGLNWVIIAEIDKKEAMRPVHKLANEIVFLSIFITLILFTAAYIISRAIATPIIDLKNATIRVRKGDYDAVLQIKSKDELGELTENFNLMTSQLKLQREELKERETKLFSSFIDGQEDERQRLSRELHDGLGQMIVATKLKTESIMNAGNTINPDNISRLRAMFDSLVDEVRGISNNLMPPVLQEFGLEVALNQICKEISNHSKIKVIFDSQIADRELDKRIATYVFRIAQEALNNAVKHSGASEIIVTLIGNERMINLMVQDDGVGINIESPNNMDGRGMNSMSERVKLLNGLIDISKGVNNGTIVSVKIPLL
jgi:signal transduction histidine kinase